MKNLPTLKKQKTLTHKPTEKKESKMTMTRKLNIDNGLQDWKTEHQAVTAPKCHAGFIGKRKCIASTNNRQI